MQFGARSADWNLPSALPHNCGREERRSLVSAFGSNGRVPLVLGLVLGLLVGILIALRFLR
jgi:hypothetical protein